VTPLILYLDQNKWIELAREYHGRSNSSAAQRALERMAPLITDGRLVAPLSAIHYMETHRHPDPSRRKRLGRCMIALSRGCTVAPWKLVLRHEVSRALRRTNLSITEIPLAYLGRGLRHAFGQELEPYQVPEELRHVMPVDLRKRIEATVEASLEASALTGVSDLVDIATLPLPHSMRNHTFRAKRDELNATIDQVPKEKRDDFLYAASFLDIASVIHDVLTEQEAALLDLGALDMDFVRTFVNSLPSRRADLQINRQSIRNPRLRAKLSDLDDFASLSPAVAYCDTTFPPSCVARH
jgi:hypothetical protein